MQVKKVAIYAGIAFTAFYLLTRPTDAAEVIRGAMDSVVNAADSLASFFARLT
ncbi:hypothetical protein SAMN05421505_1218 [Sinosporangium album]|uniref:Uncharacterized protein n=1 Tax=Sinosporangium album TaxID=504805 RepID=A0A1G8EQ38_9ACTN|nr:hypothetical protein [Sinosporangium album]SDH72013.1 hypothetical protein SAMN05421505_1218 [Sinosporangium album]